MVRPTVLMVLDGWGIAPPSPSNAISEAPDRNMQALQQTYLFTQVQAHGRAVGLMDGQMGDSNVGHLTIGAGRIIPQNLVRIFDAIDSGELAKSPVIQEVIHRAQHHRLHVMGLLSPGGVHSHQEHLKALLKIFSEAGLKEVFLHVWLDGRDVDPHSSPASLAFLAGVMNEFDIGRIASVSGRYYAMDRDKRWDRTEKAYRAMVLGEGQKAQSAVEAVLASYEHGISDEFVEPTVLVDSHGAPVATIDPEDAIFVFNFRPDRVRQITRALADPDFNAFDRPKGAMHYVAGMTQYDEEFILPHVFAPITVENNMAEWLSRQGMTQLHVAETEKYAHVTFFFNGGVEHVYDGESRILIPSPKVATYDLAPGMSAPLIADAVIEALDQGHNDFILLNFANSDMVGHTGNLEATKEAIRIVDEQIGRIARKVLEHNGLLAIVADHGNAEIMVGGHGEIHTQHSTSPVPFILVGHPSVLDSWSLRAGGGLKDVAPTVLEAMGVPIPNEMTGESLLVKGGRN